MYLLNDTLVSKLTRMFTNVDTVEEITEHKRIFKNKLDGILNQVAQERMFTEQQRYPSLLELKEIPNGYSAIFHISNVCSYEEFLSHKDYIQQATKCSFIEISNIPGYAKVNMLYDTNPKVMYRPIKVTNTQLLLGYNIYSEPIIVDMLNTPHVGVVGLSKSGKTMCIAIAIENIPDKNVILINCFDEDFRNLPDDTPRYTETEEILEVLTHLLGTYHKTPLFVVIDEYNVLSTIKAVDKAIQDLLSQARHYNIFVIVMMQLGNKEDCKFKNLFNVRIAFRTIDDSTLRAFIGTNEKQITEPRHFLVFHSKLERGITYFRE